jgi:hypothetical protein
VPYDFNGGTGPDLLWQDPVSGSSQVWFMGGPQGITLTGAATISGPNPWQIAAVADFNNDGTPDLVWQDPANGAAQVWYLGGPQGNELISAVDITSGNPWRIVCAANFKLGGSPGLLWQDPVSGASQIWILGGGVTGLSPISAVNLSGPNTWRIVGCADFNGDGQPDVVWQDPVSGAAQVWYLSGPSGNVISSAADITTSNPWRLAAMADYNLDGHPDLVWQDPKSGESQIWFMGGAQGTDIIGSAVVSGPNPWHIVGPR